MMVRIFQLKSCVRIPVCPQPAFPGRLWRGWALLVWWASVGWLAAQEPAAERDLSEQIVMGAPDAFYPYSYVEAGSPLQGFAIDIAEAVARAVKLKLTWQPMTNLELEGALLSGRIDALPFWSETKARRALVDFSVPVARFETVIVVRKDDKTIRSMADLKGRRVAVGQKGNVSELCVTERQPGAILIYAKTTETFLRQLAAGNCDAAVMSRLTAVAAIEHHGLRNLKVLEGVQGYDVRYCMTVGKGDTLLLARFNEGLAIIHRTGEFDDIYHKWFGRFERPALTPFQIISYVAAALALICAGATWGFFRQRTLLSRIAKQTAELAEQRSLLGALYDKHPLATVVLDIPTQGAVALVSLNQEASLLYGLEQNASVGRSLADLGLTKEMRAHLEEAVTRHRASNQSARWEIRLPVSQRVLEVVTMPLGAAKDASRLCVLSADITKRRLMDQEIAKSRRLRALGELVGGIAHEFNNLLTPIMATASMLRSSKPPVIVSPAELNIIDQSAQRAADLTRRLLAFGRKTDDPSRTVRLTEAVANCEALLKTMIDRRIEWVNDLPADLPPVTFNPTDFNQIVFNLVLNGRDTLLEKLAKNPDQTWQPQLRVSVTELPAGARPPRVGVSRDGLSGWQRFTVEDNGMGIPPEIVDRIFEPFFTTKEVGKGTGLGLSTVWHQVTDTGGEIAVDSKPGEGTAFHVYLPRRETRTPLPTTAGELVRSVVPMAVTGSRILIVEDEPLIASTTTQILQRLGYAVAHRGDGEQAWKELSSGSSGYDLLLIDLSMPRMSGADLVRRVRTLPGSMCIVVMSGRVSDDELLELKTLKVDRILAKPFTTEHLKTVVSEVLISHKP
jgi:signal transduction histidine kinase/ABC-type amino acid transport substrate-binding protein/CheY-like chemotaxis protein